MKVWLLNPPADDGVKQVREGRCMQRAGAWTAIWTPLSLAYCAAVLREDGCEVLLTDAIVEEVSFADVRKIASDFRPDAVIINAVTPSIVSDLSTADHIKDACPGAKVAAIGIHGTAVPEDTLGLNPRVDFVVRGEPEIVVRNLCRAIRDGADASSVKGLSFVRDGKFIHTENEAPIQDLDTLPLPAYDLIKTEKYLLPFSSKRFLLIATGRGCNFGCTFCADHVYYGRKVRLRTPARIAEELKHWKDTLGIRDFLFWSESFTLNRDFACDVAREIIAKKLDVDWVCNSRVDNVDDEMLSLFKKAGCTMIGYGVESGNEEILRNMNKRTTLQQIIDGVNLTKKNGIEVVAHTIIGFPGETEKDILQTIRFVKNLAIDFAQFYCAVPFPGSALYKEAREKGWIASDDWRMFEQNFSVIKVDGMSPEKIMKLRNRAYRVFYMRPKMVVKLIKKLYAQGGVLRTFSILSDFLSWI